VRVRGNPNTGTQMFKLLAALSAIVFSSLAYAATLPSIAVVYPVANVDGSPILATGPTSLASARVQTVECTSASAATWSAGVSTVITPLPASPIELNGLTPGVLYCVRLFAKNAAGEESPASNVVTRKVALPRPNASVIQ